MMKLKKISECGINILSGQIMSRVTTKSDMEEEVEKRKVIIPKAICSDGTINIEDLTEESLKTSVDERRVTKAGDIVIKLSTPYDAAMIDRKTEGCIVPSFCAIIRSDNIDSWYLLAFLNSSYCKDQLRRQVAGAVMTLLSVGKIKEILIPCPSIEEQKEIGERYKETQRKLNVMRQIIALETQRNDVLFKELVKTNG